MSTLTAPTATISCPPLSPMLFPATMRDSRLDVAVTGASPRIGLQARWVSVFDADGHDHLETSCEYRRDPPACPIACGRPSGCGGRRGHEVQLASSCVASLSTIRGYLSGPRWLQHRQWGHTRHAQRPSRSSHASVRPWAG